MQRRMFAVLAAVTLVIAISGGAYASSDTVSVGASATVAEVCVVNSGGTIAFGTVDTGSSGAIAATVTAPDFACTNPTAVSVTDDLGANDFGGNMRMTDGLGNYITYEISYNAALTGQGLATNIGDAAYLNLTAQIPAGNLAGAIVGNYTDTITLTISY